MSNTPLNVFIVTGGMERATRPIFMRKGFNLVDRMTDANIVCLTGGSDISPAIYNQTHLDGRVATLSDRDKHELDNINEAVDLGLFMFGICRGGQLLNVFNGGTLWQHVEGHGGSHKITDCMTERSLVTSSVHHQAFRVTSEATIVATSTGISRAKYGLDRKWLPGVNSDTGDEVDVEACWYEKTRSLCVQGHPEFGPTAFTEYCFQLIERFY